MLTLDEQNEIVQKVKPCSTCVHVRPTKQHKDREKQLEFAKCNATGTYCNIERDDDHPTVYPCGIMGKLYEVGPEHPDYDYYRDQTAFWLKPDRWVGIDPHSQPFWEN